MMIKKQMKILYKEVEMVHRRLQKGGYFGDNHWDTYYGANSYHIILKDGTGFTISIGTTAFPLMPKKDVAYICKKHSYNLGGADTYTDTDEGRYIRDIHEQSEYLRSKMTKYHYDAEKEIDTGCW